MKEANSSLPKSKRGRLDYYRGLLDVSHIDMTLPLSNEGKQAPQLLFSMTQKRCFYNTQDLKLSTTKKPQKLNPALDQGISSINSVSWGGYNEFQDQFAYVDDTGSVVLWDLRKNKRVVESGVSYSMLMTCSVEQKNSKLLAVGGIEPKITIFSINNKEDLNKISRRNELTGHIGSITCGNFLDEIYFVSGSNDSSIILWDIEQEGRSFVQFTDHETEVTCLDVCDYNGNFFASGSADKTARVWDIRQEQPAMRLFNSEQQNSSTITAIKFMPGRTSTIAIGSEDGKVGLYDSRALGNLGMYKMEGKERSVTSLVFTKSGRILLAGYNNGEILAWDIMTTRLLGILNPTHTKAVTSLAVAPDGKRVLSASKDGSISIWEKK